MKKSFFFFLAISLTLSKASAVLVTGEWDRPQSVQAIQQPSAIYVGTFDRAKKMLGLGNAEQTTGRRPGSSSGK